MFAELPELLLRSDEGHRHLRQDDPLTFLERPVALIPRPRSVKEECLERLIFFGAPSLTRALDNYVEHHQHERDHQSCENLIPSHR